MGYSRPLDWATIAAHDHEEAFADRRRTVITRAQFAIINIISEPIHQLLRLLATSFDRQKLINLSQCRVISRNASGQHADKCNECFASAGRIRTHFIVQQRSPRFELFHILQHHHARSLRQCPAQNNPGQTAYLFFHWLCAFCLREVSAVRAKPCQADRITAGGSYRIHVKNGFTIMQCVRVIRLVHRNGVFVVVDRNIHAAPDRQFNTR